MNILVTSLCALMPALLPMNNKQAKNVCQYEEVIVQEAEKNKIEPELLASVIYVESGFFSHVVSSANACGLTQVIPKYTGGPETGYKKYNCKQLKDPTTSIKVGAQILAYHIKVYGKGNIDVGLCYYSTGNVCLRDKTRHKKSYYVRKVKNVYDTITDGC